MLNITLPAFSALPSIESVTSNSLSERLFAETLIWMLMAGCCCCGAREEGAFGFSNDRSLVYWASTLSWGGACSGGAPLPLVMKISPDARASAGPWFVRVRPADGKCVFRASGYHSPGSFHKDVRSGGELPGANCGGYAQYRPACGQ